MTAAGKFGITDGGVGETRVRLRPAESRADRISRQVAGPFEAKPSQRAGSVMRDALVTGLLVIYPAFATVAAIVVSLVLAGGGA